MTTKPENFRNAPKPNFDLYVISFICSENEAKNLQTGDIHFAQIPDFGMG